MKFSEGLSMKLLSSLYSYRQFFFAAAFAQLCSNALAMERPPLAKPVAKPAAPPAAQIDRALERRQKTIINCALTTQSIEEFKLHIANALNPKNALDPDRPLSSWYTMLTGIMAPVDPITERPVPMDPRNPLHAAKLIIIVQKLDEKIRILADDNNTFTLFLIFFSEHPQLQAIKQVKDFYVGLQNAHQYPWPAPYKGYGNNKEMTCIICADDVPAYDVPQLACGHQGNCIYCLNEQLIIALREKKSALLRCPEPKCLKVLEVEDIPKITNSVPQRDAYAAIRTQEWIRTQDGAKLCQTPDCGFAFIHAGGRAPITCGSCKKTYCNTCLLPHQMAITCEAALEEKRLSNMTPQERDEERNRAFIKENTKPCPHCKVPIEKNAGCNHMTCKNCHRHFWWCHLTTNYPTACNICNTHNYPNPPAPAWPPAPQPQPAPAWDPFGNRQPEPRWGGNVPRPRPWQFEPEVEPLRPPPPA